MTVTEKVQLIGLLDLYKRELALKNIAEGRQLIPTKALYTHARIIADKLAIEVERALKTKWDE